jgi:O-antigen/teichoic acid export membrane protein
LNRNNSLAIQQQSAAISQLLGDSKEIVSSSTTERLARRKFVRDIAFSNLPVPFQKLQTYLWLALLTRTLGPAGFGAWSLFMITLSSATTVSTLNCGSSLMRFLSGSRTEGEVNQAFSTVLLMVGVAGILLGAAFLLFSSQLTYGIFGSAQSSALIALLAVALLFNSIFEEIKNVLRARRCNRSWAWLSLARLAPETLAVILAALWLKNTDSVVSAYVFVSVCSMCAGMIYLKAKHGIRVARPDRHIFVKYANYGLPLLPGVFASTLSLGADKYVISHFLGLKEVGIYTVCFAISAAVFFLTGPINDVLFPELSALYDGGSWSVFCERFCSVQKFVLAFAFGMAAILVAMPRHVLRLVAPPEFAAGSATLAVLGFQGICMAIVLLYVVVLNTRMRIWSTTFFWLLSGAAIILLDIFLVPRMGILGAALSQLLATAAGAFVLIGMHWKLFYETFEVKWLAQLSFAFLVIWITGLLAGNQSDTFLRTSFLLGTSATIFAGCLYCTGYFTLPEIRGCAAALFERHA